MNYIFGVVFVFVTQFLLAPASATGEVTAYSMNKDWQSCKTSGIVDSQKYASCITYPDSGKDFKSCENPPKAIYFARHADKRFRDITGKNNAPQYILSRVGQKMAQHLPATFDSVDVKAIYTSDYTRTRQTACPLSTSKGLDRQIVCKTETKSDRFLQSALCKSHKDEVVVVIGHFDTVKEMLINLKVIEPRDGLEIKYGELYKVTFKNGYGKLERNPIRYWNCGPMGCDNNGALDVKLE